MMNDARRPPRRTSPPLFLLLPSLLAAACAPAGNGSEAAPTPEGPDEPYLVMVSFDGMRHDFIDRVPTPSFDRVAEAGVTAGGLIPAYPSKTFPNHYTLATGLYPAHHGIVDNSFYDPVFDATYALADRQSVEDGRWYLGEPIWVTAETQGVRAASFFWVGSEAPVQGVRPTYFKYYDDAVPNTARVDTVLEWLDLPAADRPQLVMLYFDDVDAVAHRRGPDHPAVDSTIRAMDRLLGRLLDGLQALPVGERVNVVIVSDHGMAPVPADSVVYLEDLVDLTGVRAVENTTQVLLYFDGDEAREWEVYEALTERLRHATAYLEHELPARWQYEGSRRIGDIVVAAEPGWIVGARRSERAWAGGGTHGWDPAFPPMHGIFLAAGPGIRSAGVIPAFENIHVYPLAARLLDLEPADVDGDLDVLGGLLTPSALAR